MRYPFGKEACELEREEYGQRYPEFFFKDAPFVESAIDREVYLFIGRRGSGKSSLAHSFSFHPRADFRHVVDVDDPKMYSDIIRQVAKLQLCGDEGVSAAEEIWELAIWNLIFHKFKEKCPACKRACFVTKRANGATRILKAIFRALIDRLLPESDIGDSIEAMLDDELFLRAREEALEWAEREAIVVAVDSQERYDIYNDEMMTVTAALIQAASKMTSRYAKRGVSLKVFMSAEVYPHLTERHVTNPLKYVRDEVFLHWRPKDLARLICWRFYKYLLDERPEEVEGLEEPDWTNYEEVHRRIWMRFFGRTVDNALGIREATFPFLLRHTQLRPRQLVKLCNAIAQSSKERGEFPTVSQIDITNTAYQVERALAVEVINSYEKAYPNIGHILDALNGIELRFKGNRLDQCAHRTASAWPRDTYSQSRFRELVAELGIVGRVRQESGGFVEADFEYNMEGRLTLNDATDCVIHPMFGKKLNVKVNEELVVYPFPDHPDFLL